MRLGTSSATPLMIGSWRILRPPSTEARLTTLGTPTALDACTTILERPSEKICVWRMGSSFALQLNGLSEFSEAICPVVRVDPADTIRNAATTVRRVLLMERNARAEATDMPVEPGIGMEPLKIMPSLIWRQKVVRERPCDV